MCYRKTSGFTLIEMIVVIAIIMILLGIGIFPYGYYLERGYTERAADGIAQEWVLAHKAVRGGIEFDPIVGNHARIFFIFEKGTSEIQSYLLSGSTIPDIDPLSLDPNRIQLYKTFVMENGVTLLDFTGSLFHIGNKIGYLISPPFGDSIFFTGTSIPGTFMTGARITIGYPGADVHTGRAREILLRPYLK